MLYTINFNNPTQTTQSQFAKLNLDLLDIERQAADQVVYKLMGTKEALLEFVKMYGFSKSYSKYFRKVK